MTASISFDVTVEVHEPSGAFVARCADFPGKVGIGLTEAEAVADLRARMPQEFLKPLPPMVAANPWKTLPGLYPNDELTQEWERVVRERRLIEDTPEPERG